MHQGHEGYSQGGQGEEVAVPAVIQVQNGQALHGRTGEEHEIGAVGEKRAVDVEHEPGFYWGAEGGAAFKLNKPNTAYLAVPKSYSPAAILLFDLQTSIEDALKAANAEGEPIYDLSGRRVVKPSKGIYLLNGRKVVFE